MSIIKIRKTQIPSEVVIHSTSSESHSLGAPQVLKPAVRVRMQRIHQISIFPANQAHEVLQFSTRHFTLV